MSDTKRLTVMKALTDHIRDSIDGTGGYTNNLEGEVWRGRLDYGEEQKLPFVSLIESPEQPEIPVKGGEDMFHVRPTIFVQGWHKDDLDNPTDPLYLLLGDLEKCLHPLTQKNGFTALGLIGFEMSPGVVRPPDKTSLTSYCQVEIKPKFTQKVGDPYELDI